MRQPNQLTCSFCHKSVDQVASLIAGPTVFICNECVDICIEILAVKPDWRERQVANLRRLRKQTG